MANSSSLLTPTQQAQLADWTKNLRALMAAKAKLHQTQAALVGAYNAANGISSILASLQATDVIDDGTGLAGAGPFTKQALLDRTSDMNTDIAAWPLATYLPLWAQIAGPINVLP